MAYGYLVEGIKPHTRIVPDDTIVWGAWTGADVVRHLYERVGLGGWSCRRAAEELNTLGVPTHARLDGPGRRRKATPGVWREGVVRRLLREPKYRGEHAWGRTSPHHEKLRAVPIEALVSVELWQAAQDTLARNRIMARNTERVYLLRSVMRCDTCGQAYAGSCDGKRGDVIWYRCGGQRKERGRYEGRCPGKMIRGDHLERIIWQDIERFLRDPGDLLDELHAAEEHGSERTRRTEELAGLSRTLAALDERRAKAVSAFTRGVLTEAELSAERTSIDEEAIGVSARIENLEAADVAPEPVLLDDLEVIRARLDEGLNPQTRQEIVRLLAPRIDVHTTVNPDGTKDVRVTINYAFPIAVVHARIRTRADLDYNNAQRVVHLPPGGRWPRKVAA